MSVRCGKCGDNQGRVFELVCVRVPVESVRLKLIGTLHNQAAVGPARPSPRKCPTRPYRLSSSTLTPTYHPNRSAPPRHRASLHPTRLLTTRLTSPPARPHQPASLSNMARNEEKSQSMLFRFREAQAASLGLVGRTDRRPRVASSCKDLRQCERWRGEILRDISRKVSKIQDCE